MIWIELAVPGQTVEKPLDVRSEDGVQSRVVDFVQVFPKTVPEVKGDLHHLDHREQNHTQNHNADQTGRHPN